MVIFYKKIGFQPLNAFNENLNAPALVVIEVQVQVTLSSVNW